MSKFKIGDIVRLKNYNNSFGEIKGVIKQQILNDQYIIDDTFGPENECDLSHCSLTRDDIERLDCVINRLVPQYTNDELDYLYRQLRELKHRWDF